MKRFTLLAYYLVVLGASVSHAQTFASETFDACYTGPLSCPGWTGDGTVEESRSDNVLVLKPGMSGTVAARWEPDYGGGFMKGRTYRISVAMRTEGLTGDLQLSALISRDDSETVYRSSAGGARGTSSWHRLNLVFVPKTSGRLSVAIEIFPPTGDDSPTSSRGRAFVDDILITESDFDSPGIWFTNVCPDGQFANLARSENDCEQLDVSLSDLGFAERDILEERLHIDTYAVLGGNREANLGFDHHDFGPGSYSFPTDTISVSDCSGDGIQAAIDLAVSRNGAVVRLPECTVQLLAPIAVDRSTGLVLEGRGIGRTVFELLPGGRPRPAILVDRSQNLIVRDLSLNLDNQPQANINISRSDNVLVERVEVSNAGSASIRSMHTTRMTLRYSTIDGGPKAFNDPGCQGHWFASDQPSSNDRDRDGKGSTSECELKWGSDFAPGATWSASYLAHSNIAVENNFALHLTLAEVAGNRFLRTASNKVADAHFIWIHDNEFRANSPNSRVATFRTSTDGIVDRVPSQIVLYNNRFIDNSNYPVRAMENHVYIVDNEYRGGIVDATANRKRLLILSKRVAICSGTSEHSLLLSGDLGPNPPKVVDLDPGGICDLTNPGTFWSRADVSSGR